MKPMWTVPGTYRATITDEEGFVVREWDIVIQTYEPSPHVCQFCETPLRLHWWDPCTFTPILPTAAARAYGPTAVEEIGRSAPSPEGPQPRDARPMACGCVDGMGRMSENCHSYGLCHQKMRDMADRAKAQRPSFDELQTAAYYAMQPEGDRPECSVFYCSAEGAQFTDDQQWVCAEHKR